MKLFLVVCLFVCFVLFCFLLFFFFIFSPQWLSVFPFSVQILSSVFIKTNVFVCVVFSVPSLTVEGFLFCQISLNFDVV